MRILLRLILCVIGFAGLIGTGYAWIVSSPTGASPDDDFHQTSIWCPMPIEDHCPIIRYEDNGQPVVEVPLTVDASSVRYAFHPDISAATLIGMDDQTPSTTTRLNTGEYPGYYYLVMNLFVEPDVDRSILVMRWVNFGIAIVMYGAALLLLGTPQRRLLTYTLLCAALPINLYFTTSVNPSSWAFTGIVSLWIGLEGFFTSQGVRRMGLGIVAVVGAVLASAARIDSAIYCAIVAAAMTIFHFRRVWARKLFLILPLVTALIGAASYLVVHQSSTVSSEPGDAGGPLINPVRLFLSNVAHLPRFLLYFWDTDLGWFDVHSPTVTGVLLLLVTIVWAGYCFIQVRCGWHKAVAIILVGAAVYGLPVLFMQMQQMYLAAWGFQARYVAPLMIVFFGLIMTGSPKTDPPRLPWWVTVPCLAGLITAHGVLLHTLIRRYVTGTDVSGFNLNPGAEWWRSAGPSPMATWVMGTVGLAVGIASWLILISMKPPADPVGSVSPLPPSTEKPVVTNIV